MKITYYIALLLLSGWAATTNNTQTMVETRTPCENRDYPSTVVHVGSRRSNSKMPKQTSK